MRRTSPRPANPGLVVRAFEIPDAVCAHWRSQVAQRAVARDAWLQRFERYRLDHPDQAAEFERVFAGRLPEGWRDAVPTFAPGARVATRVSGGQALDAFGAKLPELVGGSADVLPSTHTVINGSGDVNCGDWTGRNIHFGVREHAMGAICNGMAAHGGWRPFCSTFFSFRDYMLEPIRLAALMVAGRVRVHPRSDRAWRGWPDASADRAAGRPARDAGHPRDPPGRRQRERTGLGRSDRRLGPTAIVLSPGPAHPRSRGARRKPRRPWSRRVTMRQSWRAGPRSRWRLAPANCSRRRRCCPRRFDVVHGDLPRAPRAERAEVLPLELPTVAVEAASPFGWHEFADDVVGLTRFGLRRRARSSTRSSDHARGGG